MEEVAYIEDKLSFVKKNILDDKNDILILTEKSVQLHVIQEEPHVSVCKLQMGDLIFLVFAVHLLSPLFKEEQARNDIVTELSRDIEKLEKDKLGEQGCSIVVGDFNLQPYAHGMVSKQGLNATMNSARALKGLRNQKSKDKFGRSIRKFYYNPMWSIMGADKVVQGTYYSGSDSKNESVYWYTWDQVLIRPELISHFPMNELQVITSIEEISLLRNSIINSKEFSGHLPIIFEID